MTRGDLTQFWETAESVANITGHLANQFAPDQREDAYTFGLLQNIGVALIMQKYIDYDEIEYQAQTNQQPIIEVEADFYETTHTTLGYILARSWNLSTDLSQAILRHHDLTAFDEQDSIPKTSKSLIALGTLASRMHDDLNQLPEKWDWSILGSSVRQQLGITEQEYQELKASWAAIS
jgi:HD-like signal output (HDOD) protein